MIRAIIIVFLTVVFVVARGQSQTPVRVNYHVDTLGKQQYPGGCIRMPLIIRQAKPDKVKFDCVDVQDIVSDMDIFISEVEMELMFGWDSSCTIDSVYFVSSDGQDQFEGNDFEEFVRKIQLYYTGWPVEKCANGLRIECEDMDRRGRVEVSLYIMSCGY